MATAAEIHLADVEQQLAGGDARDVEQVLDQLRLGVRVAIDALERVLASLRRQLAAPQQVHPADDGVERRAELVRERGEELVLQAVGLLLALEQLGALALRRSISSSMRLNACTSTPISSRVGCVARIE